MGEKGGIHIWGKGPGRLNSFTERVENHRRWGGGKKHAGTPFGRRTKGECGCQRAGDRGDPGVTNGDRQSPKGKNRKGTVCEEISGREDGMGGIGRKGGRNVTKKNYREVCVKNTA